MSVEATDTEGLVARLEDRIGSLDARLKDEPNRRIRKHLHRDAALLREAATALRGMEEALRAAEALLSITPGDPSNDPEQMAAWEAWDAARRVLTQGETEP